ncbi:uncharacterized protein LOC134440748 isoform X2 [Engraulis encrasicolus]
MKHKHLQDEVKDGVKRLLLQECDMLCAPKNDFMLWKCSPADLKSFSFHHLIDDLHRLAPFLLSIFTCISNGNNFAGCSAAAIALRGRKPQMAAFSYWINTILQYGGAKKSVFNRLSQLSITTCHRTATVKQHQLAHGCGADFLEFQRGMQTDKNSPAPICEDSHETCPSPYSIIMDNLDFFIHTRNQSISRSNQSIHWINHIAVKDRISTDISNIKPTVNIEQYNLCLSLPSRSTQVFLRRELTVLATRMLAKHMPVFESFQDTVVHHIPHEYSSEMSKRSTDFPLGLLFKDENKKGDLLEVLRLIQQEYMPKDPAGAQHLLIGGDRLTEANCRNTQWQFADAYDEKKRMEGMHFKFEDWHAIRVMFEIHHKIFFKESAKDHGTLYANMTKLRCSTAKSGPRSAFNAYRDFVIKDTTALFLAAVMEHLGLQHVTDCPESLIPQHIKEASPEDRRTWLDYLVVEVVDKYVLLPDIEEVAEAASKELSATSIQKNEFPCRMEGCSRMFTYPKSRQSHELKMHNLTMPTDATPTSHTDIDHRFEHSTARLGFGFILLDFLDAVKEGDGERLMRLYRIALLFYKAYGHTNYAYSTFLLTVQLNATFSPQVAHSVKWNRFWNNRGGMGRNIPLDLHLEHLNGFLKSFLKGLGPNLNEVSAARISRSIGVYKQMMENTDSELGISRPSGSHHIDMTNDILTLVETMQETNPFKETPGRAYAAFPGFRRQILTKLCHKALWKWMRDKVNDWRGAPL